MKKHLFALVMGVVVGLSLAACGDGDSSEGTSSDPVLGDPPVAPSLTGTWSGHVQTVAMTLFLTETSGTIHGSYESETGGRGTIEGTLTGNTVAFTLTLSVPPGGQKIDFNGGVNDARTSMSGTYHFQGDAATAPWDATK